MTVHPEWDHNFSACNSPLTIKMKDGKEHKKVCIHARGDPGHQLNSDEVMKKYMDCIDFAGILSHERAEEAADMILALEKLNDVSELMNILTFPGKQ